MRSFHPYFDGLAPTLHIAHRGGAALAPENTLAAFEQAVERCQTDVLELDVQLSRDGHWVVSHDASVERCTDGTGAISQLNLRELQALDAGHRFTADGGKTFPFRGKGIKIPTFTDVLRAFPNLRLNVDVKPEAAGAEESFALLVTQEKAEKRICCGSELDDAAGRLHRALPDGCHFYPRQALTALVMALKTGQPPPSDDRFSVLDMPMSYQGMRLLDGPFIERTRALGKWVNVWTIDDPTEMRALVAMSVGGIMTDRPDLLREVLDGK